MKITDTERTTAPGNRAPPDPLPRPAFFMFPCSVSPSLLSSASSAPSSEWSHRVSWELLACVVQRFSGWPRNLSVCPSLLAVRLGVRSASPTMAQGGTFLPSLSFRMFYHMYHFYIHCKPHNIANSNHFLL